ncbi:DNA-binding response regulator [Paenibacillus sp. FSL A5-0031]|uniref:response regulator transcription factor n=1 Tax=unclassified Paenibacillus TaxID=185978 RepID=UPI00096D314D|nr:response regulator transcription factor [Paenibacillus sp. FSL A5-0031]OME74089.1 DNA-binding response regulator [Paenibacillus sp. FSL A5-0031]
MELTKILIIEDEEAIADLLAYGLQKEGFQTKLAHNGKDGLREIEEFKPDLLLLDWMLPDQSGLDICKQIMGKYMLPIIMITARSDISDKVIGMELGADDYITKPFDMREVIVRIRTLLRRINPITAVNEEAAPAIIKFKTIEINVPERMVKKDNELIELTPKEFDLLMTLTSSRGRVFTRSNLLDLVWGYNYFGDTRTVDIHIQRLRKKLDANDIITTVFRVGYKFEKNVE